MNGRLSNFNRVRVASFFVLLAPLLQHYLPSCGQPISLAAAEEGTGSIPPATQPGQLPLAFGQEKVKVPILVYHHVRQSVSVGSRVERRLTVTAEVFDLQMKYLDDNGYHVIEGLSRCPRFFHI
jgi:hypothetical protein